MLLALAQINPKVGDIDANADLIARWTAQARDAGADVVVFPELALVGYPPRDLLYQEGFVTAAADAAKAIGEASSNGITVIFGVPLPVDLADATSGPRHIGRGIANSLVAYRDGKLMGTYDKRLLPTYDVFDEDRYFVAGSRAVVIQTPIRSGEHVSIGLSICEDLWRGDDVGFAQRYHNFPDPVADLMTTGASPPRLIVNPSASPFVLGKGARHRNILRKHATRHSVFVAAVNQVGGNDELIFDGHAAVIDPRGNLIAAGVGFEESLTLCRIDGSARTVADPLVEHPDDRHLFNALRIGIRDYLRKTGFKSAVLGLSGGIDSAVVAVLAAAALGPENVLGIGLPSRYSSEGSVSDARELATRLGIDFKLVPIENGFATLLSTLGPVFEGRQPDLAEENLQSRIRGTLLMAASNKLGRLLLTTGNKSEMAVGYCTLYGDMNGGLAVLSDTTKEWVYRLAKWMNANWSTLGIPGLKGPPIPDASITKPPSAELRPDQTDQDSLPPYSVLDEIIERYVGARESVSTIIKKTGLDDATVKRVIRLIDTSEFKRRQAATGLKVTGVAFGSGRRMPIAQGWRSR